MKKISLIFKETSEEMIKKSAGGASTVFVVKYSGVASPDMSNLRQTLKGTRANLFVVKNTVARRALKDSMLSSLIPSIEGPCGFVFVNDEDPVATSKALCNFVKDHEKMVLEGAVLADKLLKKNDIEALAKMPPKDVVRAMALGALKSPITSFVFVLSGTLKKLVYCLDQIKQKKGQ
jgi:large subunit ribosomal protein L10